MNAMISGIGWVTAAGMGRGREYDTFAVTDGQLPRLTSNKIFGSNAYKRFGRMDRYSKLGLAAITFALKDAGLDGWKKKRPIGIIASTVYGCLGTDIDYYDTVIPQEGLLASPHLFAYTLPNCFLGDAAIRFGLTGTSFVVNEHCLSGLIGLQMALDSIVLGESDKVLAGVCDLGPPALLQSAGKARPCAIFLVIERLSDRCSSPYGELGLNEKGAVLFNEKEIEDLIGLVHQCLSDSHHLVGQKGNLVP